jgi:hypothetical protein
MTTVLVLLVLAVSLIAVGVLRVGGLRWLWLLCALVLLALVVLALFLSAIYSVPSASLVILYLVGFVGPSFLFATGSLTLANSYARRTLLVELITALAGSIIGLGVGFVVVVYVLGVW